MTTGIATWLTLAMRGATFMADKITLPTWKQTRGKTARGSRSMVHLGQTMHRGSTIENQQTSAMDFMGRTDRKRCGCDACVALSLFTKPDDLQNARIAGSARHFGRVLGNIFGFSWRQDWVPGTERGNIFRHRPDLSDGFTDRLSSGVHQFDSESSKLPVKTR